MSNDNRKPRKEREPRNVGTPCNHNGCSYNRFGNCIHPAPVRSFDRCNDDDTPVPVQEWDIHDTLAEAEREGQYGY